MLNKCMFIGNISEPKISYIGAKNICCVKFSLAVNRIYKKEKKTDWIYCCLMHEIADKNADFLTKGRKILVVGRMETREYKEQTYYELRVNELIYLDSKKVADVALNSEEENDSPPF